MHFRIKTAPAPKNDKSNTIVKKICNLKYDIKCIIHFQEQSSSPTYFQPRTNPRNLAILRNCGQSPCYMYVDHQDGQTGALGIDWYILPNPGNRVFNLNCLKTNNKTAVFLAPCCWGCFTRRNVCNPVAEIPYWWRKSMFA